LCDDCDRVCLCDDVAALVQTTELIESSPSPVAPVDHVRLRQAASPQVSSSHTTTRRPAPRYPCCPIVIGSHPLHLRPPQLFILPRHLFSSLSLSALVIPRSSQTSLLSAISLSFFLKTLVPYFSQASNTHNLTEI